MPCLRLRLTFPFDRPFNVIIGARAMHTVQDYGVEEAVYNGKAYLFTGTFHDGTGTTQTYITRPAPPKTG